MGYQSEREVRLCVIVAYIGSLHCRSGQESTNTLEKNDSGILTISTDMSFFHFRLKQDTLVSSCEVAAIPMNNPSRNLCITPPVKLTYLIFFIYLKYI
jgi:hypothetical protein